MPLLSKSTFCDMLPFSPFPHGTYSLSETKIGFRLRGRSPDIQAKLRDLLYSKRKKEFSFYGAFTLFSRTFNFFQKKYLFFILLANFRVRSPLLTKSPLIFSNLSYWDVSLHLGFHLIFEFFSLSRKKTVNQICPNRVCFHHGKIKIKRHLSSLYIFADYASVFSS